MLDFHSWVKKGLKKLSNCYILLPFLVWSHLQSMLFSWIFVKNTHSLSFSMCSWLRTGWTVWNLPYDDRTIGSLWRLDHELQSSTVIRFLSVVNQSVRLLCFWQSVPGYNRLLIGLILCEAGMNTRYCVCDSRNIIGNRSTWFRLLTFILSLVIKSINIYAESWSDSDLESEMMMLFGLQKVWRIFDPFFHWETIVCCCCWC